MNVNGNADMREPDSTPSTNTMSPPALGLMPASGLTPASMRDSGPTPTGDVRLREPDQHRSLELEIGELSLEGFPGVDRDLVRAAIQRELSRLLAEPNMAEILTKLRNRVEFDGGNFRMPRSSHPDEIGAEIARALVRGLRA